MISIKNFNKYIHYSWRGYIGRDIAKKARELGIRYEKINNENHYPIEFLESYFLENPVPIKNENCEPITLEMIKVLPIKLLVPTTYDLELTTDGKYIFHKTKCVGYWKN